MKKALPLFVGVAFILFSAYLFLGRKCKCTITIPSNEFSHPSIIIDGCYEDSSSICKILEVRPDVQLESNNLNPFLFKKNGTIQYCGISKSYEINEVFNRAVLHFSNGSSTFNNCIENKKNKQNIELRIYSDSCYLNLFEDYDSFIQKAEIGVNALSRILFLNTEYTLTNEFAKFDSSNGSIISPLPEFCLINTIGSPEYPHFINFFVYSVFSNSHRAGYGAGNNTVQAKLEIFKPNLILHEVLHALEFREEDNHDTIGYIFNNWSSIGAIKLPLFRALKVNKIYGVKLDSLNAKYNLPLDTSINQLLRERNNLQNGIAQLDANYFRDPPHEDNSDEEGTDNLHEDLFELQGSSLNATMNYYYLISELDAIYDYEGSLDCNRISQLQSRSVIDILEETVDGIDNTIQKNIPIFIPLIKKNKEILKKEYAMITAYMTSEEKSKYYSETDYITLGMYSFYSKRKDYLLSQLESSIQIINKSMSSGGIKKINPNLASTFKKFISNKPQISKIRGLENTNPRGDDSDRNKPQPTSSDGNGSGPLTPGPSGGPNVPTGPLGGPKPPRSPDVKKEDFIDGSLIDTTKRIKRDT